MSEIIIPILLKISFLVAAMFLAWLISHDSEEWKAWRAVKKEGVAGFYRYKIFRVASDDMMRENPIIWCYEEQFFTLADFIGRGHKLVSPKVWKIHYLLKLPYFWHARV